MAKPKQPPELRVIAAMNDLDVAFAMIDRALNEIWGAGVLQMENEKLAAKIAKHVRRTVSKDTWEEHVRNDRVLNGKGLEDWVNYP